MVRGLLLLGLLLSTQNVCFGNEGFRYPLLDGSDLDRWKVTGCQVGVENGSLVLQDGDGFVRSHHRYRNFILELQWRARKDKDWDSGIYIRAELPADGKPWPKQYQINLRQGQEGNLIGVPEATSQGLVKAGEWNRFKLTVLDKTAKLEINGQPAWETEKLSDGDGYIGFQAEVPLGGQFEFKDIVITELGFTPLFNGKDLTGWEGAGQPAEKCWKVEDNMIVCTGEKGPWLRTDKEYGDFSLRLEYKLKPGGNSGIYVRVPSDGDHHGDGAGVEIQVLDDQAPRYEKLKAYQYTGSVYAIVPAEPRVARKAGEWNTLEIDCRDKRYRITHNGIVVVNASPEVFAELGGRRTSGFLGLQNHSEEVWYRNLRIGGSLP